MALLSLNEADDDLPRILAHLAAALPRLLDHNDAPLLTTHQCLQFQAI
jgi:hypothetical protein